MGQRAYKRKSNGQFAGGGGGQGTKVTMGRAGGFANSQHQQKAQAGKARVQRQAMARAQRRIIIKKVVPVAVAYGAAGAIHMASNRITPARLGAARDRRFLKTANRNRAAENHYLKRLPVGAMIVKAAVNGVHQTTQVL